MFLAILDMLIRVRWRLADWLLRSAHVSPRARERIKNPVWLSRYEKLYGPVDGGEYIQ